MRNVVISGANRGIGLGLVKYFVAKGDRVIAGCRNPDSSPELVAIAETTKVGQLLIHTLDVESDVSVSAFAKKAAEFINIDILINNAGILLDRDQGLAELSLSNVSKTLAVNAVAPIRVTQAFLPLLQKSKSAVVAQISSSMGSIADNTSGGYYAYRMSKTAVNMFNKTLSKEFPNIISLAMHPGWVQTEMGGTQAPTTVEQSTIGLGQFFDNCTSAQSGGFYDFRGKNLTW